MEFIFAILSNAYAMLGVEAGAVVLLAVLLIAFGASSVLRLVAALVIAVVAGVFFYMVIRHGGDEGPSGAAASWLALTIAAIVVLLLVKRFLGWIAFWLVAGLALALPVYNQLNFVLIERPAVVEHGVAASNGGLSTILAMMISLAAVPLIFAIPIAGLTPWRR